MAITRRKFLGRTAAAVAASYLPWKLGARAARAFYQSPGTIPLYVNPLRGVYPLDPGGIPVAVPDTMTGPLGTPVLKPAPVTGVTHYTIGIGQFTDSIAPGLGSTTLWGFHPANALGGAPPQRHLGGILIGEKGVPIQLTFRNTLPATPIIPIDVTVPGANQGANRTAVHFHGGLVPWISDGGPFDWFNPTGGTGVSFKNNAVLNPGALPGEAEYYYPLNQSARFGWYHDHAFGITRTNAYAGIASALFIRDAFERGLRALGLPDLIENGGREIPLVFQDKIFVGQNILAVDPTWTGPTAAGSLWYAHTYERNRWRLSGNAAGGGAGNPALPDPSVIAEFFGDTMLVNGTAFPKVTVEARRYRLRMLNACNARFLNLQLYVADATPEGITLNPATGVPTNAAALCDPNAPGTSAAFLQIGTEGGFLPFPAKMPTNLPFNPLNPLKGSLVVAPAERPDVLVDFSAYAGKDLILYNDAPAPFPVGDPRNDYFPGWNLKGNPVNALTAPGFGPNSRVLMRFHVVGATSADPALAITPGTNLQNGNDPLHMPPGVTVPPAVNGTRQLSLNESFDPYGRLIQMLGTLVPLGSPSAGLGRAYLDPTTENPLNNTTEIWEIYNTTGDVHPMHFHLVNVQIINRQPFQVSSLGSTQGGVNFTGPATPPEPNETGWKETVMMVPGTVTRIIMRFSLPQIVTAAGGVVTTPVSPRTGGHEYVWHCHILEHEEHDMMRPLVVT